MFQKILISLLAILCCSFVGLKAASYDIQLSATTEKTTCYTDGKIFVKLSGADFGLLAANDQLSFNVQKDGKSYKQHDLTMADIRADSVFVLEGYPAGAYLIDYSIWIGTNIEIKGSIPQFTVEAKEYKEPVVFQTLGDNKMMQGTRPSLICKPTGRIQLEIVQGKFPYTVQVFKDGAFFRTEVFASRMFSGLNPLAEDYRDYYNIEQLGIGSYTFTVTDSCGYQRTLAETILVQDVNFSCVPNYAVLASAGATQVNFALIKGFFNNVKYDNFSSQWLEYRFALEGEALGAWKAFSLSDMATIASLDSVKGKKFMFELRVKDCPSSYPVCHAEVLIPGPVTPPPPPPCEKAISPSVMLIPVPGSGGADFCACDGGTPSAVIYDKWQVITDFTICAPFTLPLTYKWKNIEFPQYSYSNTNVNSAIWSYTSPEYALGDSLYNTQIHIELFDAAGVVYLDTLIRIPPKPQAPKPTPPVELIWTTALSISGGIACGGNPVGTISVNVNCGNIPDGAEIKMTEALNGYSLTGRYDLANRNWIFSPSTFTDFTITQSAYSASACVSAVNLNFNQLIRYGTYKFVIKWKNLNGVDTTVSINRTVSNNFMRYEISENLTFTTKKTCQGTIFYPSAQVLSWVFGDEANKTPAITKFRVISGNITGYEINGGTSSVGQCKRDSLLITKPGRYIVESFHSPIGGNVPYASVTACTVSTDTIDYEIPTLSFEDYYGYLCADSRGSTIRGSVTVIAKDGSGVPPYRYDLYSGKDLSGTLIGSNNTGVFNDVKVSTAEFYVRVEDQCLSSFVVAIPLSPVITTDAVFGDRSVCLGSPAHLQGKMIGANNQVSYLWTGKDGFSSSNRIITTPPILEPSTFSLEISGLGCTIFDSITVSPVDKINISYEDFICQGTNYDGGREYKQPIATALLPIGTHSFSSGPFPAVNGGCDSTASLTLHIIDPNTVIEDTMIICDTQFPFLWQDSLFTQGAPSGLYYKSKLQNNCAYKRALRLTVGHPSDTLLERIICAGESVVLNGNTYTQSGTYTEIFRANTTCDSVVTLHLRVIEPNHTELVDSIYQGESYNNNGFTLPVQNDIGNKYESNLYKNYFGCDSVVYLRLMVMSSSVLIPEIFTPNGDGKNAFFEIKNIELYPRNHLFIFNRWGNKVYEGKPYMNEWDGRNYFGPKVGGNLLPVGTYYYLLDLGDGSDVIRGFIYLNR